MVVFAHVDIGEVFAEVIFESGFDYRAALLFVHEEDDGLILACEKTGVGEFGRGLGFNFDIHLRNSLGLGWVNVCLL